MEEEEEDNECVPDSRSPFAVAWITPIRFCVRWALLSRDVWGFGCSLERCQHERSRLVKRPYALTLL